MDLVNLLLQLPMHFDDSFKLALFPVQSSNLLGQFDLLLLQAEHVWVVDPAYFETDCARVVVHLNRLVLLIKKLHIVFGKAVFECLD